MKLSHRLLLLTLFSLLGLLLLGAVSLYLSRQGLLAEKHAQIEQLLQIAESVVSQQAQLAAEGKIPEAEAKKQALLALASAHAKDGYYFVRDSGNFMLYHPDTKRIGKYDDGGKRPDGKTSVEVYAEALATEHYAKVVVTASRKGSKEEYPKLNGVVRVQPWGWVIGTGFFIDDIDATFWRQASLLLGLILFGMLAVGGLAWRLSRSILHSLGGDPAHAAHVVKAIAEGDLTQHIAADVPADSLLGSMRSMLQNLLTMVSDIRASSLEIEHNGNTLQQHMVQLKQRSQQASAATTSAATAIEELSASIDHVSSNARATESDAHTTSEEAASGSKLTEEARHSITQIASQITSVNQHMQSLTERTRNISGIAGTIREIANQTNLLALNAAIEAARAGETGRGFAVVADEVRKLAERTAVATDEIATIVQAVVQDTSTVSEQVQAIGPTVSDGVTRIHDASQSLQAINARAHASLDRFRAVAQAMDEQSKAGGHLAGNVEEVVSVVESAQASAEHAMLQAQAIHQCAVKLQSSVNRFRTREH
ncbi:methyl-accepting chemotaxis protein [Leeia aquatica]|uniref:Methyl-accepting chemotaxis protein n=1 Tax=Leeia aquatica TaxID=2725557 RepID=A0A847SH40_9NEIS|nr:methyl-accepting chemotaxis protein [Leeia aquatica]NLR75242.1 methyl-accepting chemotaxis protein [Leeia aquatica]